jgi:hypothetical protein
MMSHDVWSGKVNKVPIVDIAGVLEVKGLDLFFCRIVATNIRVNEQEKRERSFFMH